MLFDCMQVYERTHDVIVLCQDLDDIYNDYDRRTSVQEFRFRDENMRKLRDFVESMGMRTWEYKHRTGIPAIADYVGWLYHHGSHLQSFFECDAFAKDCRAAGIAYERQSLRTIWSSPERPDEEDAFVDTLRVRGIILPENYRPGTVGGTDKYWPLAIDLVTKAATEILGITPCACYSTSHVIIPYRDLRLFEL